MNNPTDRRKEISDFAQKLIELTKLAPDGYARRDINRTLHHLRQRYKVSPEQKKLEVLEKLANGANRFAELLDETGFSRKQIERALKDLQTDKKIEMRKIRLHDSGRPVICYFPV